MSREHDTEYEHKISFTLGVHNTGHGHGRHWMALCQESACEGQLFETALVQNCQPGFDHQDNDGKEDADDGNGR